MLSSLESPTGGFIINIDGRSGGDMTHQLKHVLDEIKNPYLIKWRDAFDKTPKSKSIPGELAKDLARVIITDASSLETLLVTIASECRAGPITLIVDEANNFLNAKQGDSKEILDMLVKMTKQTKKINVILSSSNFTFPYSLTGFNTAVLDPFFVTGDVSPKDTYKLLRECGMGDELAKELIGVFGGHLFLIRRAIGHIAFEKERYKPIMTYDPFNTSFVERAMKQNEQFNGRMQEALIQLAEKGFYPLEGDDPLGKALAKLDIAGFVPINAKVPESVVPQSVRNDEAGMVPTSQVIRVILASDLVKKGLEDYQSTKKWWWWNK